MNLTWEQTQNTTYTGLTQADWDAMPGRSSPTPASR